MADPIRVYAQGDGLLREYDRLHALYRMTAALSRAVALEEIHEEALKALRAALGVSRASVLLFDDADVMRFVAWSGISASYRTAVEGHSPWRPDSRDAVPVVVPDVAADESLAEYRETILREGIRSLAMIPLNYGGGVLGKLMLYYVEPRAVPADEIELATTIAAHVAIAVARQKAETALRRSQAEYAALAENAPDIIARFDPQLRHSYVNAAAARAAGRSVAEMLHRTNAELGMPADKVQTWGAAILQVFATGRSSRLEFSFFAPAGERRYEALLTPECTDGGTVTSVLSVTRDVTPRWRGQLRERLLARIGDAIVDTGSIPEMLDRFAALMIGELSDGCAIDLCGADGAIERAALATRNAETAGLLRELDEKYPTSPESVLPHMTALRSGEPVLLEAVSEPLIRELAESEEHFDLGRRLGLQSLLAAPLRARGRVLGVVTLGTLRDGRRYGSDDVALAVELTERLALAIDNARLYEATVAASAAKSAFLATMSHELRTPLNAIFGYVDLLEAGVGGSLNEVQAGQLQRIQASSRHLLTLIEGLLTFSRLEAGGERVHDDAFDLRDVIGDAVALIGPAAAAKRLDVRVRLPDARVEMRSDRSKIFQILLNLLGNAVKFTDAGHVEVTLEAGTAHVVRVADSGIGIAAADQAKVFEAFWQADRGTTRRRDGTGLGLTVSRQLAELLGGTLSLESEPGKGTIFELRLLAAG
jgi:PAS domain S-box-containing protein